MNGGKFDGGQLSASEKYLRDFYKRLFNFTVSSPALMGNFADLHTINRKETAGYNDKLYSFVRWSNDQKLIVISNFSDNASFSGSLKVPAHIIKNWTMKDRAFPLKEELYGRTNFSMQVINGTGNINVTLQPLESLVLSLP
jgi:hypothetical protein